MFTGCVCDGGTVNRTRHEQLISIRCDELRRLSDGWNDPDDRAPTEAALCAVERIVNRLEVIPLSNGGVAVVFAGSPCLVVRRDGTPVRIPDPFYHSAGY